MSVINNYFSISQIRKNNKNAEDIRIPKIKQFIFTQTHNLCRNNLENPII